MTNKPRLSAYIESLLEEGEDPATTKIDTLLGRVADAKFVPSRAVLVLLQKSRDQCVASFLRNVGLIANRQKIVPENLNDTIAGL